MVRGGWQGDYGRDKGGYFLGFTKNHKFTNKLSNPENFEKRIEKNPKIVYSSDRVHTTGGEVG